MPSVYVKETTGCWLNYQSYKTHFSCNLKLIIKFCLNVSLGLNSFDYQKKQFPVIFGQIILFEEWMKKLFLGAWKTWHIMNDMLAPEYEF